VAKKVKKTKKLFFSVHKRKNRIFDAHFSDVVFTVKERSERGVEERRKLLKEKNLKIEIKLISKLKSFKL